MLLSLVFVVVAAVADAVFVAVVVGWLLLMALLFVCC